VTPSYPQSFQGLQAWAKANNIPADLAKLRFAQYVILRAITNSRSLSGFLVFKGGNALDFMWQPNRSTLDLDFSIARVVLDLGHEADNLRELFTRALGAIGPQFGVLCRVATVKQEPAGSNKTFVTYRVQIAYALPDQEPLRRRMEVRPEWPGSQHIKVEISINEPICADEQIDIAGTNLLRVSTIEDIVAEKLRALLQQPIRNRTRPQDLLDIAVILRTETPLDHYKVADFLLRKADARNIPVSKSAFYDVEIMGRANAGYDELKKTARTLFIPFEEARDLLYAFVDTLTIDEA